MMNFIVLICDTLRYDHIGWNRRRAIHTPNFDKLAAGGWSFDRCYTGSYPSQPHRCDCATGRFVFPFYAWQKMPEEETHLVPLLAEAGYRTHIIADSGLPFNLGLARGFQSTDHLDELIDDELIKATPMPCDPGKSRTPKSLHTFWAKRTHLWKKEEDWPQARVMQTASSWIKENKDAPFFLWVESWRIHEPWVDPQEFVDLYDPGYSGEIVALPSYSPNVDYLTPAELNHIRAMYAASVTFTDKWFGSLMSTLEETGLLDNTCVIASADHGWSLGDHNRTGKHAVESPKQEPWPLYEECTHVPLIVRMPGQNTSGCRKEIVQHADIMPTVLDLTGLESPDTVKACSWMPLLEGKDCKTRDFAVTSTIVDVFPKCGTTRTTITSDTWTLILPTDRGQPELYNLAIDPGQTMNVFRLHKDIADGLLADFRKLLQYLETDPRKIESYEKIW